MTDKATVDLSGAAQTMLTTLYLKALDAEGPAPVLGDRFARDTVAGLDYDWDTLGVGRGWAPLVTVRTALYDSWAREFLERNPEATVVHLGCGLDSRVFRLDPGPEVRWFDVDFPRVIALREQVYPARDGYRLLASSATDTAWLEEIPADRPTLFLAEGISMYLTASEGADLLQRIVDRFPRGELQIDFYSRLTIASQRLHKLNRTTGSTLHWGVDRPSDVLGAVTGIRPLDAVTFFDAETFDESSRGFRAARRVARVLPPLRRSLQYHRYGFGPID
ncbi:class I SAM-dependent methyltransferase [Tsukamurella sp. 8F]|uniref:class I SAM-dependent methyltransferase n=1 Tax=unclassified Tsukamurella TaxID=2633480 RepID=UPI0023B9AE73|nr:MULTISPECIES: class I SAM-dependent methyltransferase [unclassified Tsukamurella]MDF0530501.1 class I SAM-dependent methyltransferase [Tsukamurella sp. 8J]MDF0586849.1 class I SAM-dependent methyltransferase [Tsukamurella sp. 8F]